MVFNTALKMAIFESGQTQERVARKAHMHASDLSKVIRGRRDATADEQKALAKVLNKPVHALFSEVAA